MGVESDIVSNGKALEEEVAEIKELKNPIKSIDEIPQVLEEEDVKQPVIYLENTINGKKRSVVLLGEIHIATQKEERAASRILPYFSWIGCEGVDVQGFIEGRFYFWVRDNIVSNIIAVLPLKEKRSKKNKSFIDKAKEYSDSKTKKVFMLEAGWKPNIRLRFFFVAATLIVFTIPVLIFKIMSMIAVSSTEIASNHGSGWALVFIAVVVVFSALFNKILLTLRIIDYIIDFINDYIFDLGPSRDRNMVKNLISALEESEAIDEIIILTGADHTVPIAKLLKNRHGFVEKSFCGSGGY